MDGLLANARKNPGAIVATIIKPYKEILGDKTLRDRVDRLEKQGLVRIERRFKRAYVFPINSQE